MLTKNVKETVKKKGRLGCCLIDSGQTGKSIYTAVCLVQYWLPLKVNATALKLTVSKVRVLIAKNSYAANPANQFTFYKGLAINDLESSSL